MESHVVLVLFLSLTTPAILAAEQETFFPKPLFGVVLNGTVVRGTTLDFTGQDTYRIEAWVRKESGEDVKTFIHRTYQDFEHFDSLKPWFYKFKLPHIDHANEVSLNGYLQRVFQSRALVDMEMFSDFIGINWDGTESLYMRDFATFMRMLTQDRIPMFAPEPPIFASEADGVVEEVCPFENYIFLKSFRHDDMGLENFLDYYGKYVDSLPAYEGEEDHSDVWLPGATEPVEYPYHYLTTQVHFNPGRSDIQIYNYSKFLSYFMFT